MIVPDGKAGAEQEMQNARYWDAMITHILMKKIERDEIFARRLIALAK